MYFHDSIFNFCCLCTRLCSLISLNAAVTVGLSDTTYSAAEGNVTVCVSVQSGVLGPNVTIYYFIIAVNNTASGEKWKLLKRKCSKMREGRERSANTSCLRRRIGSEGSHMHVRKLHL